MVKHVSEKTPAKTRKEKRRKVESRLNKEEEEFFQAATIYLICKHGGLLVATGLRKEKIQGNSRWILTVTLRYPTGHEGYIGDLLFDGKAFSFLTPLEIRKERARQIATDPNGIRKWQEYRNSTLRAGKA